MSERYYITGVQIGIIKAFAERVTKMSAGSLNGNAVIEIEKIMKEVEDKQFIGKITNPEEKVIIAG